MSETGQREMLGVGDYGRLPVEQVIGMLDNVENVRALWDHTDITGDDAKTMATSIVQAGGVLEKIVAYPDGKVRKGHRRLRALVRLFAHFKEHGLESLDGITAHVEVVEREGAFKDLKAEIVSNNSLFEQVDFVWAYRLLAEQGMHQIAIGQLLGHDKVQAGLYAALAESAGPKLIEALKAGRVAVGTLRSLAALPAEVRAKWLDVAAAEGASVAMMRYEGERAAASSPDGEIPPEVTEKIERAEQKLADDKAAGRTQDVQARNTEAIIRKGLEESPWTLAKVMQTLTTLATPENMIAYTLLGIFQGWTAESDQAQFFSSLGEIMKDGSVAATAKGRILKLTDRIIKAKKKDGATTSFVRPARIARKAGAEKAVKPAKSTREISNKEVGKDRAATRKLNAKLKGSKVSGGSVAKAKASGARKKTTSKKKASAAPVEVSA